MKNTIGLVLCMVLISAGSGNAASADRPELATKEDDFVLHNFTFKDGETLKDLKLVAALETYRAWVRVPARLKPIDFSLATEKSRRRRNGQSAKFLSTPAAA